MRRAIGQSLPRCSGSARGAAPLEREVVEVGGIPGGTFNLSEDRLRRFGIQFHLGATATAVHVPVGNHLLKVIGLPTIHPVMVCCEAEFLQQVERAVDRRGCCRWVSLTHPLYQLRTRGVTVGGGEHVGDQLPLLRPPLTARLHSRLQAGGKCPLGLRSSSHQRKDTGWLIATCCNKLISWLSALGWPEGGDMYPLLHIPDGFLSPQISLLLWLTTAVVIGIAVRQASRTAGGPLSSQPILMGVLGAFIFAAQMFNFPVATGTSGHLLGGVLAGYLLGPWAGTIVMATVVGIQALLFQDGGLLVLGANIFNMGIVGTLGGSIVARGIGTTLGSSRVATVVGAGVAAWLAVVAAAGFTTIQLGLSATTNIAIALPAMLGVHALIGIGEGLITVAALTFIAQNAPDVLVGASAPQKASPARRFAIGIAIAGGIAAMASLFASADPDGLEAVAEQLGFLHAGTPAPFELFPDYTIPGLDGTASTIAAGLLGIIVVAGVLLGLGRLARARAKS